MLQIIVDLLDFSNFSDDITGEPEFLFLKLFAYLTTTNRVDEYLKLDGLLLLFFYFFCINVMT